jgi:hypothetical protein
MLQIAGISHLSLCHLSSRISHLSSLISHLSSLISHPSSPISHLPSHNNPPQLSARVLSFDPIGAIHPLDEPQAGTIPLTSRRLALGGGFGYLSGEHGMVVNNIVGATVVLSNGNVVHCSKTENEDVSGLRDRHFGRILLHARDCATRGCAARCPVEPRYPFHRAGIVSEVQPGRVPIAVLFDTPCARSVPPLTPYSSSGRSAARAAISASSRNSSSSATNNVPPCFAGSCFSPPTSSRRSSRRWTVGGEGDQSGGDDAGSLPRWSGWSGEYILFAIAERVSVDHVDAPGDGSMAGV